VTDTVDPLELSRTLIRCASVTPVDDGALDVLEAALEKLGFRCHRLPFSEEGSDTVDNLFARIGDGASHFCFAGHTDVVPIGDRDDWSVDPFGGQVREGRLYGRGATDMKGAVAAFVAAASRFLVERGGRPNGSISLLITGDEEDIAVNGTAKVLPWLADRGEVPDACLVGEPTNPSALGEMAKIGRRGSLSGRLVVEGVQGHTAYPELADNPIPRLTAMLDAIAGPDLDAGTEYFPPSHAVITTIDVGNPATNVIPARAEAGFNIRFNDRHTGESLTDWLTERCRAVGGDHALEVSVSGEAFLTPPGALSDLVQGAVQRVTGRRPELGTTGGTSDARFIKDYCPVVEFGLISETAHKVDENVPVDDIRSLAEIYHAVLTDYFGG
jgi:succinyl-diaminopimelate desuccinylase